MDVQVSLIRHPQLPQELSLPTLSNVLCSDSHSKLLTELQGLWVCPDPGGCLCPSPACRREMLGAGMALEGAPGTSHPGHRGDCGQCPSRHLLPKAEVTGVALPECWWSGWHRGHAQVLLGRRCQAEAPPPLCPPSLTGACKQLHPWEGALWGHKAPTPSKTLSLTGLP